MSARKRTTAAARRGRGAARRRGAAVRRRSHVWLRGRWRPVLGCAAVLVLAGIVYWSRIWPYLLGAAVGAALALGCWRLWRADRVARAEHREWERQDAVRAGHRTLAEVDGMSGGAFEDLVASLCRRDGCTGVRRVGGAGDNGADVLGVLPDGRSMVIQCKRYAVSRAIPARDMRELAGARGYFRAEVAVLVTTSRFTAQALTFAASQHLVPVHRDQLALWHAGNPLTQFLTLEGAGQGDAAHNRRRRLPN
ncbi:restriction endonuclease [Streptomyces iconiensis]|uniref:Restriction endonuclease n=1 Tax=Streptomyces iconiensis TaxID=1384038 RepID=A0ABT6ZNT7_9ACTN|nr:restriction endonuclease [Streptomyces iconiensis]MDJ1130727.1 restriction endonuclease [Streptomyces iconiensis]